MHMDPQHCPENSNSVSRSTTLRPGPELGGERVQLDEAAAAEQCVRGGGAEAARPPVREGEEGQPRGAGGMEAGAGGAPGYIQGAAGGCSRLNRERALLCDRR